ncbi:hypothetical protein C4D60_Mb09t03140 [Musa balbisiana]|uniref:Uncharacterized protein n=1 Tax=Musa balbisiana TaxID=52838 RepID=A0A4S8IDN1_MUSBA|nr:hypothetical protein C4D60_Mb09t03140 [Musa balbisiana]
MLWDMRLIQRMGTVPFILTKDGKRYSARPAPPPRRRVARSPVLRLHFFVMPRTIASYDGKPSLFCFLHCQLMSDQPSLMDPLRSETRLDRQLCCQLMAKATGLLAYLKHVKPLPKRATERQLCQRYWTHSNLSTRGDKRY